MTMKPYLILIFLILINSCKTKKNDQQTLDFKYFQLKTPADWTIFKERGIDSYVGGLTNGKDSMWFDYGWYSAEISEDTSSKHLYGTDTINGLTGIIRIPKTDGQGSISLSIPHVNDKYKFYLGGYNIKGTETILKIFKSITFKESDTTKNSSLILAKFKSFPLVSGRFLYSANCASCHHSTIYLTGPPLEDIFKVRNSDWVYQFLTNRKLLLADSRHKVKVKKAGDLKCLEFPGMTKEDVEQILSYIKVR